MTGRTRWIFIALGAMLLVGAPTAWYLSQPAPTVGELPDAFVVQDDEAVEEPPTSRADDDTTDEDTDADEGDPDGNGANGDDAVEAAPTRTRAPRPVSVSIPSIGVDGADVVEVGLDDNRAVAIPDDVSQVGWYNRGPRPGEDGNAFMTSHIDSRTQGPGVLFDLRRSEPGDLIEVEHEDGSTTQWEVVHRERITKGSYPMERVFRFDGPPGLVIDTCGGPWDPETRSYENIDIVYAIPLGADYDTTDLAAPASG
jgi:hypothetical protein